MSTRIHVSKKLETLIKKHMTPIGGTENIGLLGKWNATVFYVNRTKNWLLYNPKSHYSLILENIKAKDLPNIQEKIVQELHLQLVVDGINTTQQQVTWLLDEIRFHSTDGDRSALSYMNQILYTIECHLDGDLYHSLTQINTYLNDSIFSLDGASKYTNITRPRKEMEKILKNYLAPSLEKPIDPSLLD